MLGEKLPAEKAYKDGLVTRLVKDEEVESTASALAEKLASGPTRALTMLRRAAWDALDDDLTGQLARERDLQREAGRTKDFVEGVTAFLEKRPAKFTGE